MGRSMHTTSGISHNKCEHLCPLIKKVFVIWWSSNQITSISLSKSRTTKTRKQEWTMKPDLLIFDVKQSLWSRTPSYRPTSKTQGRKGVNNAPLRPYLNFYDPNMLILISCIQLTSYFCTVRSPSSLKMRRSKMVLVLFWKMALNSIEKTAFSENSQ